MRFGIVALMVGSVFAAAHTLAAEYESAVARFEVDTVVDGLRQPSAMVFLPSGRALLCDRRTATLYLVDVDARSLKAIEGLPPMLAAGDAGLHDIVLHPDFAENGWIYFSYSEGEPHYSTVVVDRAVLVEEARLTDRRRIITADAYSEDRTHYGGRLAFSGDYLFITVGDRHHQERAQDLDNHAGSILRVYDDGRIPDDNPFVAEHPKHGAIWSYGHRNPQGLAGEPGTGRLWSSEHGPLVGDELNVIERGANYGWPVVSWGFEYEGGPIGKGIVREEGMQDPTWVWSTTLAPSDLVFYSGKAIPAWQNSLFTGGLGGIHLNRLVMRNDRMVLEERLLFADVGRVRMVEEGPDGAIYIGTDNGHLRRIRPASRQR